MMTTYRHNPYLPVVITPSVAPESRIDDPLAATYVSQSDSSDEGTIHGGCVSPRCDSLSMSCAPSTGPATPAMTAVPRATAAPRGPHPKNTDKVANHYKTRMCKTFTAQGRCPYDVFCRFAHGEADLRTYAKNVRAGLTTEDAVRAHQQVLAAEKKKGRMSAPHHSGMAVRLNY